MTDDRTLARRGQNVWSEFTRNDAARAELLGNLGEQDLTVVKLMIGRGIDPRRSARFALSEDGQVICASGRTEDAQAIVNRICELASEQKPIPVDFAPVEWKGGEVEHLVVTLSPAALEQPRVKRTSYGHDRSLSTDAETHTGSAGNQTE